ncbi:MAG: hypothetical protein U0892_02285 [Pirellulales bacterium]
MLDRLDRWSRWTMLAAFCLMPTSIYGVLHLPVGSASVHEWLPGGRPERDRYERFLSEFGNDQFLLVSWDGCRIDDERIDAFSAKQRRKLAARGTYRRDSNDPRGCPESDGTADSTVF